MADLPDLDPDHEDDERYITVDGRRWRATNPNIPEQLRVELVGELMNARRRVHIDRADAAAVASARRRVHDAKVALGERGDPWWETRSDSMIRTHIEATIRALLRHRSEGATICPSDVARIVGSPDWRPLMDTVRAVGSTWHQLDTIEVTQGGAPVADPTTTSGPVRFRAGRAFDSDDSD